MNSVTLRWLLNRNTFDVCRDYAISIYCDLLELQIISSHNKRILRMVGTENSHIIFQNPRYIPLPCSSFSKIKIELKDLYGDVINFKSGPIILCVDIRPPLYIHLKNN